MTTHIRQDFRERVAEIMPRLLVMTTVWFCITKQSRCPPKIRARSAMNLEHAIKLATDAHDGQVDKNGEPYILHPLRVMLAVSTPDERIAAVLHDVVEDTGVTCDDLYWVHGFKPEIVSAIRALTRAAGEDYLAFIQRAKGNALARSVKIADIRDNLRPGAEHLRPRYEAALRVLIEEEVP